MNIWFMNQKVWEICIFIQIITITIVFRWKLNLSEYKPGQALSYLIRTYLTSPI